MAGGIYNADTTAGNNTSFEGIGIAGTDNVSNFDNAARALIAANAQLLRDLGGANTVGGTADAITVTPASGAISAVFDGLPIAFRAGSDNTTTSPTANVGGLGAEPIKKGVNGLETALVAGDIVAGTLYMLYWRAAWDSTNGAWEIVPLEHNSSTVQRGHINGLNTQSVESPLDFANDIIVNPGEAASDDDRPELIVLSSSITKQIDAAWAVGTNQGGLDTGSVANATYYIWLIKRSDTGVVDVLLSANPSSPTMPSNYDHKRRIGAFIRSGGANLGWESFGDMFLLDSIVNDYSNTTDGTTSVTLTVPNFLGEIRPILLSDMRATVAVNANLQIAGRAPGGAGTYNVINYIYGDGNFTRSVAHIDGTYFPNGTTMYVDLNVVSGTVAGNIIYTRGWYDARGKDNP